MELDNVETVANDLLIRAEFCDGHIDPPEYGNGFRFVVDSIRDTLKTHPIAYAVDSEAAMWQSLLTREVLLTGGL